MTRARFHEQQAGGTTPRPTREASPSSAAQPTPSSVAETVRIALIAGVRLYREGLAAELCAQPGLSVVALAEGYDDAVDAVRVSQPDVVLLDAATPRMAELVRAMKASHSSARIVAFAVEETEREIEVFAEAGVTGLVTRDVTVEGLTAAIHATVRGELTCSPRMAAILFQKVAALSSVRRAMHDERNALATLTRREREITRLLGIGRSNKEIARALNIEVATVKNHVHHILEKLYVTTRAEAAARIRVFALRES
jgi:DNA-binding NarL/FixJ family response regulator